MKTVILLSRKIRLQIRRKIYNEKNMRYNIVVHTSDFIYNVCETYFHLYMKISLVYFTNFLQL